MQTTRNTILVITLIGATAALPFATFRLDPVLLLVIPAALVGAWLTWQLLTQVQAHESDLNERLAHWHARRAVKLMQQARRAVKSSEVQP